jgi:hypothetical protein
MGYLDKTSITVDAILTKKGRELLAKSEFNIVKFALADDEVDYSLYDVAHPLGTNYYASAIENMPVMEAVPDETQSMKYKIATLESSERSTTVPTLNVPTITGTSLSVTYEQGAFIIVPETIGFNTGYEDYTLVLYNPDIAKVVVPGSTVVYADDDVNTINNPVVAVGTTFNIYALDVSAQSTTQITIYGNKTGVTETYTLTVNPKATS